MLEKHTSRASVAKGCEQQLPKSKSQCYAPTRLLRNVSGGPESPHSKPYEYASCKVRRRARG